jgi:hypothetical protein
MANVIELEKPLNLDYSLELSVFDTEDVARELERQKIQFHAVYAENNGIIFVNKNHSDDLQTAIDTVENRRNEAKQISEEILEKLKNPPKMNAYEDDDGEMRIIIPPGCLEIVAEEFALQGLPCTVTHDNVVVRSVDVAFVYMIVAEKLLEDERRKMREERAKIRYREDIDR